MLGNSEHSWGSVAKFLHWLLAVLILGQVSLGWSAAEARLSPLKLDLFVWHKSIGVTIFLLVALRLAWRSMNSPPVAPAGVAAWEKRLVQAAHGLLYVLMFAVPLSGWWVSDTSRIPFRLYWAVPVPDLMPPNADLSELAADVHGVLITLLLIVVGLHVLAALRHHFLLRNDTLLRMLPFRQDSKA